MFGNPCELITLSGGLRLALIQNSNIHTIRLAFMGKAGANFETPQEIGVAHFLEHVVFEGTQKYPTETDLTKIIKNVGGSLNGYTNRDVVTYYATLLKEDLEIGFEFLSQLYLYPLLEEQQVKKHKTIIAQEIIRNTDDPLTRFVFNIYKYMYPKTSRWAKPTIGELADVKKITRDSLVAYRSHHYHAENFVLALSGNFEKEKALRLGEKYFSALAHGQANATTPMEIDRKLKIYNENNATVQQCKFYLDFVAYDYFSSRKYAATYLAKILGAPYLSRLWKIRSELGLAYDVNATATKALDHGYFTITAGIDEKNLQKVFGIIRKELALLCSELVTEEEFDRARKNTISTFIFGAEGPMNRAEFYAYGVLFDKKLLTEQDELALYESVTIEQVRDVARELFLQEPKISVLSQTVSKSDVMGFWMGRKAV